MKKWILAMCLLFFVGVPTVLAIDLGGGLTKDAAKTAGYAPGTNRYTFAENLGNIVKAALSFVGVIFLSLTVYAGFLWMNARGDDGEIDKAKEIIKAAIIGLIITVGAYSITAFIIPRVLERTTNSVPVQQNP